jgi:beta-lactamase regulating signal transducer with metallopeptidase domain
MKTDLLLVVTTALTGFALKTALAFAVCLVLSWLADSPARRFLVWLTFLYGSAAYWLFLAKGVFAGGQASAAASSSVPVQAVRGSVRAWQIPDSWALPLGISLRVIGIAYLLVSIYMLIAQIKKHIQLKWVLGFTCQPPDELVAAFQPIARNLGVGRSRLLVLAGATSPATFGWIRPTILLPDTCLEQDSSGLEDILRHELHHVRRLDFVWNGIAIACRALLFFHPAAWYAVSRMQFDRELACDLAVVSDSPKRRARYAECLIHFARLNSTPSPTNWGIDFASSSEHLKARVHSILAETKKSPAWLIGSRVVCGVALLAGFVAVEPSLGVLLTYTQRQIVQPLAAEIRTAPPLKPDTRAKVTGKAKIARGPTLASAQVSVANVSQMPESTVVSAPQSANISASTPGDGGPQLLHRGSAAPAKASRQQILIPIDDPSGQTVKAGDHDHQQALQQTATAAAVLKRLSTFDRR